VTRFTVTEHGLLFAETATLEEVLALLREPALAAVMPEPFFLRRGRYSGKLEAVRKAPLLLKPSARAFDEAERDAVFHLVRSGEATPLSPAALYDSCRRLIKVTGCVNCDIPSRDCWSRAWVDMPDGEDFDGEAVRAAWRKAPPVVAGAEYADPAYTKNSKKHFVETIRPAEEHHLANVEAQRETLRERAAEAAETRELTRVSCGACLLKRNPSSYSKKNAPFRPGCASKPKYCSGPFADEETQRAALLAKWDPRVAAFLREGDFTEKQFWAIAAYAGMETKLGRRGVIFAGWETVSGGRFKPRAYFVRGVRRVEPDGFLARNYGEVRAVFDDLPENMEGVGERPSDELRALWYALLETDELTQRAGWGSRDRLIVVRRVTKRDVGYRLAAESGLFYGLRDVASLRSFALDAEKQWSLPVKATPLPGRTKGKSPAPPPTPTPEPSEPSEPSDEPG